MNNNVTYYWNTSGKLIAHNAILNIWVTLSHLKTLKYKLVEFHVHVTCCGERIFSLQQDFKK